MEECLFCNPYQRTEVASGNRILSDRVLYETEYFYVLLTLGPIVEGQVILIAKNHARSMVDLSSEEAQAYEYDKKNLKHLIQLAYNRPVVVTEHGRIQACIIEDTEAHDSLCYHAHQIFFPLPPDCTDFPLAFDSRKLDREGPFQRIFTGSSLAQLDKSLLADEDEYLLFEDVDGHISVCKVLGKCPRQYLRYLVARAVGKPEWASWADYRFEDKIVQAYDCYMPYAKEINNAIHREKLLPSLTAAAR